MMNELYRWQVYFKLKFQNWIPRVISIDKKYRTISKSKMKNKYLTDESLNQAYEFEFFECDEYAWILKGLVHKDRLNGIGMVFGLYMDEDKKIWPHAWNVFVTSTGKTLQVDPMKYILYKRKHGGKLPPDNYYMFKRKRISHRPIAVII